MAGRHPTACEDPEKRLAILEQAIRTFAETGFRGTDVQVIADRAGVGKGTVYRYFQNKNELFWATTLQVFLRLEQYIFAAMEGVEDPIAKLRASALAYALFFQENPHYLELFVQDRAEFRDCGPESHREHHRKLGDKISEIVQQGIESGQLRPVDPAHVTMAIGCLIYGTVVLGSHLSHLDSRPIPQMVEYAIDIFLRGLALSPPNRAGEKHHERNLAGRRNGRTRCRSAPA